MLYYACVIFWFSPLGKRQDVLNSSIIIKREFLSKCYRPTSILRRPLGERGGEREVNSVKEQWIAWYKCELDWANWIQDYMTFNSFKPTNNRHHGVPICCLALKINQLLSYYTKALYKFTSLLLTYLLSDLLGGDYSENKLESIGTITHGNLYRCYGVSNTWAYPGLGIIQ